MQHVIVIESYEKEVCIVCRYKFFGKDVRMIRWGEEILKNNVEVNATSFIYF